MSKQNLFGPEGWTPERIESLTGKTYLVTGANSGAGFQASRILLSKGAKVVMLNRSPEKSVAAIAELKQKFGGDIFNFCFVIVNRNDINTLLHLYFFQTITKRLAKLFFLFKLAPTQRLIYVHIQTQ